MKTEHIMFLAIASCFGMAGYGFTHVLPHWPVWFVGAIGLSLVAKGKL